jgi:hypothetical protein
MRATTSLGGWCNDNDDDLDGGKKYCSEEEWQHECLGSFNVENW